LRSERRGPVWLALEPPPFIYWTAITLAREARAEHVEGVHGTICDSWSALELEPLGFEHRLDEPWCVRPAGPLPDEDVPPELEVVEVSKPEEVAEFELTGARAFGGEDATVGTPFHPPTILRDPRMRLLTARLGGDPVAVAMSFRDDSAVGIYGVGTLESVRRRGYASALTLALIDPARPAILSSSPEAESVYRRLGFERVGVLRQWTSRGE
jgi:GNAT superfamily N-acetyltransferase